MDSIKQRLRIYPLSQVSNPPAMNFVNVSGRAFNTIHSMDFSFFEEVNEVIQEEPADATDPETLGLLASIGIAKGAPFVPDQRMKKSSPRPRPWVRPRARWPIPPLKEATVSEQRVENAVHRRQHEFLHKGARILEARSYFFFYATGITPAMAVKRSAPGRPMPPRSSMRRSARSRAARPIASISRRRSPPPSSGRWWSMTTRPARCSRPIRSSRVSAAKRRRVDQSRRVGRRLLRVKATGKQGGQLGADLARQGFQRDPATLRPPAVVLRQDMAAERDRRGGFVNTRRPRRGWLSSVARAGLAIVWCAVFLGSTGVAYAAKDVVITTTGEKLVGEIQRVEKDVLVFSTDYSDSDFKIKWDTVASIESDRQFLVETFDGKRVTGSLKPDPAKKLVVQVADTSVRVDSTWSAIAADSSGRSGRGSTAGLDFGYSMTRANSAKQLSLGTNLSYRDEKHVDVLLANVFRSSQENAPETQRWDLGERLPPLPGHPLVRQHDAGLPEQRGAGPGSAHDDWLRRRAIPAALAVAVPGAGRRAGVEQ